MHASNDILEKRLELTLKTEEKDRAELSGKDYRNTVRNEYRKAFINDPFYFNQGFWPFLSIDTTLPVSKEVARLVSGRILQELQFMNKETA